MEYKLNYGKEKVGVNLKGLNVDVLDVGSNLPIVKNLKREMSRAFNNPVGGKSLLVRLKNAERVTIVVPDKTRKAYVNQIMPEILLVLKKAKVKLLNVSILIANGQHKKHSKAEKKAIVGAQVLSKVKVLDHVANDEAFLVNLGTTSRGTPIFFNKLLTDADLIITIGKIGYHYFAGYNGGRKAILPGCAGIETIQANHSLTIKMKNKKPLINDDVKVANLSDNPIHLDMIEAVSHLRNIFAINVITGEKGIHKVVCGNIKSSHKKACQMWKKLTSQKFSYKYDAVVLSTGGYPWDINYIQTHKSLQLASYALKTKGQLFVVSECVEGLGSASLSTWLGKKTKSSILTALSKKYDSMGYIALKTLQITKNFNVYMFSNLTVGQLKSMRIKKLNKTTNIYSQIKKNNKHYKKMRILVLPSASNFLPIMK